MSFVDWAVVAASCVIVFIVGLWFARKASSGGLEGYFAGDRDLPWWAIALSNTATYQSGNSAFVMLVLIHGLVGNWLWWAQWIIWMPLVAILWARLWQRTGVVSVAELMSLRYGGQASTVARKLYALQAFITAVLVIAYITGFFTKTIAPLCPLESWQVLLIFGGCTIAYTMFGGLLGVVYSDVAQFIIMFIGCAIFLILAVPQFGGWAQILDKVHQVRPDGLRPIPPTTTVDTLTIAILIIQGFFNVGDGTTSQRFIAARSERHAVGGQLFNAFLSLSLRTIPLIGLGVICMAVFWTPESKLGDAPAGLTTIKDPAGAWAELIKICKLPTGFVGLLVAAEVAAYMSTLSSLVNWGSSMVVNDLMPRNFVDRHKIWTSRLTTLLLFVLAAGVTILWVNNMMNWFLFINSAMGMFMLPLAVMRFGWWRFNVWGELAAIILGLPLSILIWFVLDFQSKPAWQGLALLGGMGTITLVAIALLTPAEPLATLQGFYRRCRPPGLWSPVRRMLSPDERVGISWGGAVLSSVLGVAACLGLVLATNGIFNPAYWMQTVAGAIMCVVCGAWVMRRII